MNLKRLKGLRVEHGYSQYKMAELIGISLSSYQRKETGESQFLLIEAYTISNIFKISIEEIFFNHNYPKWDREGEAV